MYKIMDKLISLGKLTILSRSFINHCQLEIRVMDQEYSQADDGIVTEDIEKFNQQYAKLNLGDEPSQVPPTAPLIYNPSQYTMLDDNFAPTIYQYNAINFTLHNWDLIVNALHSQDIIQQHYGIIGIRKLLSIQSNPPIQQVIDAQLIPLLVLYAQQNQFLQLKFQALWALTNVASGTTLQTQAVVDKGGIQLLVDSLNSPVLAIVEQAIWAIGNLAGDNVKFRDMLIMNDTLQKLVNLIAQNSHHTSMTKNGMWALCNLCRGNPRPKYALIKNGVQFCCQYIIQKDVIETEVLIQILWVLAYPEQLKDNIDLEVANKLTPKISNYLSLPVTSIKVPSLRILSNLFENESFADCFIKNKWIQLLIPLLNSPKIAIQRETCFLISRLTDIHNYEIDQIFVSPSIVQTLLKMFVQLDVSVKTQIAYVFSNLSYLDNLQKVYTFYRQTDILKYYVTLLFGNDKNIIIALDCINRILEVGQKFSENGVNMFSIRLEQLDVISKLQNLQYSPNQKIYNAAHQMINKYFNIEQNKDELIIANNINEQFEAAPAGPGSLSHPNFFQY